jgi:polyhydroxyalkanoate synthase
MASATSPFANPNAFAIPTVPPQLLPTVPQVDLGAVMVANPSEFVRNMIALTEESSQVMAMMIARGDFTRPPAVTPDAVAEASRVWTEVWERWLAEPRSLAEAQAALLQDYMRLWQATSLRMAGQTVEPIAVPDKGDARFKDEGWTEQPYFDFWKQAYLITARWMTDMLARAEGLDPRTRHQADFMLRQIIAAMSPSNNPMTNPEVIRETLMSSGANLVAGTKNLAGDLAQSGDLLKISQVDTTAFDLGRNIGASPGKVVFQNEIIQLIQYTPSTAEVREIPFLIIPPWINKFYVLDLGPEKSFIKFLVDQGYTVFIVSWVNPDVRLAHKTFEDYMHEGILAATDAVKRECGVARINILGYCIGGTLLAATLAWLAARRETHYNSATFLVAQVDFSRAGDLKLFIDDKQLDAIEALMSKERTLDGARMATVFNLLRPKDLLWPYIVNNYMLGKKPAAFDLLYWNQDSTRMPPANHGFYLREFYHENKLALGKMTLGNVRLDLGRVKLPVFQLATREDHISPPRSVFAGAKLFGGSTEFVLAGSGHIAGVVSPPGKTKYPYWTNPKPLSHPDCTTLEDWLAGAEEIKDSWWPRWLEWLGQYSGGMVKARKPGAKLGTLEDAPGSYVKVKA